MFDNNNIQLKKRRKYCMCANKQTYNKQSLIHHFDHNNHYDHHKDIFVIYIYHLIYIRNILVDILSLF